ncbi:MAG: hypothetical protein PUH68_02685 [Bacteroidales bacterium]|nr:hypothetical protein [Bacteroidales bacterium]
MPSFYTTSFASVCSGGTPPQLSFSCLIFFLFIVPQPSPINILLAAVSPIIHSLKVSNILPHLVCGSI